MRLSRIVFGVGCTALSRAVEATWGAPIGADLPPSILWVMFAIACVVSVVVDNKTEPRR